MANQRKKDHPPVTELEQDQPEIQELNIMAAIRQGPLPPPEEMQKYESLYPGATKSLFDNFITQTNHRIELEKITIQGDNKRADKAQRNSFIIAMTILLLAAFLFYIGKDGYAIAAIITAIAPIIIAFISSSIFRKKERDSKQL